MSKTPRTDEKEFKLYDESLSRPCSVVRSSFARQLEAELAELKADRVAVSQQLSDALDTLFASNKQLANARAEVEHWKGECSDLVRMAHEMRAEIDYFQTLIDLQHKRTVEADKLWQQAHNQPNVWPDLGMLVEWLMKRADKKFSAENVRQHSAKLLDVMKEFAPEAGKELLQVQSAFVLLFDRLLQEEKKP